MLKYGLHIVIRYNIIYSYIVIYVDESVTLNSIVGDIRDDRPYTHCNINSPLRTQFQQITRVLLHQNNKELTN
jgi:hypothetical protein